MREPEVDLDRTDFSDAAETAKPDLLPPITATPKVGMSLRLETPVMQQLLEEAAARGIGHTRLAADLITAGLASLRADRSVVPLADLQLLIAQLAARTPPAA